MEISMIIKKAYENSRYFCELILIFAPQKNMVTSKNYKNLKKNCKKS